MYFCVKYNTLSMNKFYIFALIFLSVFTSCKKDNNKPVPEVMPPLSTERYDSILKETGCKVKNAENVERLFVFKDSTNNTTYLYGSRKINKQIDIWISKYNTEGEVLWDTTFISPAPSLGTSAYLFNKLNDDNFAIFQVSLGAVSEQKGTKAMVINSTTGKPKAVLDLGNYLYERMYNLKETFLIYNEEGDIGRAGGRAGTDIIQVSNAGAIIKTEKKIAAVPGSTDIILNDRSFLVIKDKVKIADIFNETVWSVDKFYYRNYEIKDHLLNIYYENSFKLIDTVVFNTKTNQIVSETHNKPVVNITMAEIGKEYKAADGLTVKVTSFSRRTNGAGTAYYAINYILKNNTKDKKAAEGIFELRYKNKDDGLMQYGLFGDLLPGESVTRSYEFKELETEEISFLSYINIAVKDPNNLIYWKAPAK